LRKNYWWWN